MPKFKRVFPAALLSLVLLLASCVPTVTHYEMPGVETVPAIELHRYAVAWMTHNGYRITVSDPHTGLVSGTIQGLYSGDVYSGYVQIFPPNNQMRWQLAFPHHNSSFGQYMQGVVQQLRR